MKQKIHLYKSGDEGVSISETFGLSETESRAIQNFANHLLSSENNDSKSVCDDLVKIYEKFDSAQEVIYAIFIFSSVLTAKGLYDEMRKKALSDLAAFFPFTILD